MKKNLTIIAGILLILAKASFAKTEGAYIGLYQIPSLKVLKKIKILTSYFWLKISKKPQLYGYTASFFKNFYLKNILL